MATIKTYESRKISGKFTFQVRVKRKGLSTITATFDTLTQAKAWGEEQEQLIKSGAFIAPITKSKTVSEALDGWLGSTEIKNPEKEKSRVELLKTIRIRNKHIDTRLGDTLVSDLTKDRIKTLIEVLKAPTQKRPKGYSADSIRLILSVLQRAWVYITDNPVHESPTSSIKKPRVNSPEFHRRPWSSFSAVVRTRWATASRF